MFRKARADLDEEKK